MGKDNQQVSFILKCNDKLDASALFVLLKTQYPSVHWHISLLKNLDLKLVVGETTPDEFVKMFGSEPKYVVSTIHNLNKGDYEAGDWQLASKPIIPDALKEYATECSLNQEIFLTD